MIPSFNNLSAQLRIRVFIQVTCSDQNFCTDSAGSDASPFTIKICALPSLLEDISHDAHLTEVSGQPHKRQVSFLSPEGKMLMPWDKINFSHLCRPTQANRVCSSLMTVHNQEAKVSTKEKRVLLKFLKRSEISHDHNTMA